MNGYNHVCEDCGHEWEDAHATEREADNARCPACSSDNTEAYRQS